MDWNYYNQLLLNIWNWEPDENSWWVIFIKECKIPGLKDAIKPKINLLKRIAFVAYVFWCLWLCVKTSIAFFLIIKTSPVQFTFESIPTHVSQIPSPSIVFGKRVNFSTRSLQTLKRFIRQSEKFGEVKFDEGNTVSEEEIHRLGFMINHICQQTDRNNKWYSDYTSSALDFLSTLQKGLTVYDRIQDKETLQFKKPLMDFIINGIPRCSIIAKHCSINGNPVNCDRYVTDIQTDIGASCAINKPPDAALKKHLGLYSLLNNNGFCMEDYEFWRKWQLNEHVFEKKPVKANCSKFSNTYPMTQTLSGKKHGFSFVLEFDANDIKCMQIEGMGYFLDLLTPLDEPELSNRGIAIPMNHEVFIAIDPDITVAEESIRKYDMMLRGCSFTDEVKLKHYLHYTQANCERERLAELTIQKCNCYMISFPNKNGTRICTTEADIKCSLKVESNYVENNHSIYSNDEHETICLPSCTEIKYNERISYIPYDPENPPSIVRESTNSSKMTSIIHIFMEREFYNSKIRGARFDDSQIFATIGGTLGTTNGLCYIDAGRVIYHLLEIFWNIFQFILSLLIVRFSQTFSRRRYNSIIPPPPPSPSDPNAIQFFQLNFTELDPHENYDISPTGESHIKSTRKGITFPTFPTLPSINDIDIETDLDSDFDDILLTPEPYERTEVIMIAIESDEDEESEVESANYDLLMNIFPPPFPLNLRRISRQVSQEDFNPLQRIYRMFRGSRNRIFDHFNENNANSQ